MGELSQKGPPPDSADWAAQAALAEILRDPRQPPRPILERLYPRHGRSFIDDAFVIAWKHIKELVEPSRRRDGGSRATLDQYSFSWALLRQADLRIRKFPKEELHDRGSLADARRAFDDLLSAPLTEPLLVAMVKQLRLGPNACYLPQYWFVRRANRPTQLPPPFAYAIKNDNRDHFATVVWWLLRARRDAYVEFDERDGVRVAFNFLLETILKDLTGWFGRELQPERAAPVVEEQINRWLTYSGLQAPSDKTDGGMTEINPADLAKAFVKYNDLTGKLLIERSATRPPDERVGALEAQLRQYVDENRALEETNRALKGRLEQVSGAASPPVSSESVNEPVALREFLKIIDSKYSLDALDAVLAGDETHLTLRSFVAHLFYGARKHGLSRYPEAETFNLEYDDSGLYDCEGFEVPVGSGVPVSVVRHGWALKTRGRLLPVRRARVAKRSEG